MHNTAPNAYYPESVPSSCVHACVESATRENDSSANLPGSFCVNSSILIRSSSDVNAQQTSL